MTCCKTLSCCSCFDVAVIISKFKHSTTHISLSHPLLLCQGAGGVGLAGGGDANADLFCSLVFPARDFDTCDSSAVL